MKEKRNNAPSNALQSSIYSFFPLDFVLLTDLHKVLREKERLVQLPSSPNTKKEKNIKTKTRKRKVYLVFRAGKKCLGDFIWRSLVHCKALHKQLSPQVSPFLEAMHSLSSPLQALISHQLDFRIKNQTVRTSMLEKQTNTLKIIRILEH